jgi:hypothetical protein
MKTIYRIKRLSSINASSHNAIWIGDFSEKEKRKYLKENKGVFLIEEIIVTG